MQPAKYRSVFEFGKRNKRTAASETQTEFVLHISGGSLFFNAELQSHFDFNTGGRVWQPA
ncbi:MAG TPA: hypothetical protein DEF33_00135 [Clostridiales bacterium]|nr:hypothetical protein [Clostridiales bacterium]